MGQYSIGANTEALTELFSGRYALLEALSSGTIESTDLFGNMARQVKAQAEAQRLIAAAKSLSSREQFLHWSLAFPTVWADADFSRNGFDAIIGNPPWDRIKMQEVEWFAERRAEIAMATKASDRASMIKALAKAKDPLWRDYEAASKAAIDAARVVRECGDYPLLSGGDINLYSLFVERASSLVKPTGIVGLLTPSGISADKGAAEFFKSISQTGRLGALYDFENRKIFFPDIHASFKFCVLVFGASARQFEATSCAFYLRRVEELQKPARLLALTAADFAAVNPNTGGAPIFRSKRDADITIRIYREFPVLVDRQSRLPKSVWPVRYMTMFHMTNDSNLFKTRSDLEKVGWYPIAANHWKKGAAEAVPLYEGKMVQMYDHRAANVVMNVENMHRAAQQVSATLSEHENVEFSPTSQFFVDKEEVKKVYGGAWALGFKEITAATNSRSMIAALLPGNAFGNKLPLLLPDCSPQIYAQFAPLLAANFNSFIFDFALRQKLHGQTLNLFIVEQLPVIPPGVFEKKIGKTVIADFVREQVLRLTYTAHDMAAFARDMGYEGAPFGWDEDDRRHRIARLDALFFQLYGIGRDDADYILSTFPIVREHEEKVHGRYLTRDLVLAYMNAIAAGDLATVVTI